MTETTLHRQMTTLARDLEKERSAESTLRKVVETARELIGPCRSAGITLATRGGDVKTSVATDDVPKRGDELQIELGEGPCRDAVWKQHTVLVRDLPHDHRWRRWAPAASEELGMRSMLCLRLFTHEDRIGALNLYAPDADAFDAEDVDVGHAVAAHAAVAVVAAEKIEHLETGLVNRAVIGQATGIIMNGYGMTSTAAFEVLVRLSSRGNRKLADVARELVADHDRSRQHTPAPTDRSGSGLLAPRPSRGPSQGLSRGPSRGPSPGPSPGTPPRPSPPA